MKSYNRTTTKKFKEDNEIGTKGENEIIEFLKSRGLNFIATSKMLYTDDRWKLFDLLFENKNRKEIKVEVKSDHYVSDNNDSGNMVIELSCNGKPSGLSTSISNLWVYYFPKLSKDNVWLIKTGELKQLIIDEKIPVVIGGDGNRARMVKIPRNIYKDKFKVYTYNFSKQICKETKCSNTGYVTYQGQGPFNKYGDVFKW